MNPAFINNPLFACWPFWVLELKPDANNPDIDRAGRTIISKINLGVKQAEQYLTPIGPRIRDEPIIREAQSKLQDPAYRLLAEYWYVDPTLVTAPFSHMDPTSISEWQKKLRVAMWEV